MDVPEPLVSTVPEVAHIFGPLASSYGAVRSIQAMTVNGAWALGSSSSGIGNDVDTQLLAYARQWSDCVLVGAATVRAENYYGVRHNPVSVRRRRERDQRDVPPIAVLTRSLSIDPGCQFFRDTAVAPIVIVPAGCLRDADYRAAAAAYERVGAEVWPLLDTSPSAVVAELRRRGYSRILLEGGPSVAAAYHGAGVVDVLYTTVAPLWAGPRLPVSSGSPDDVAVESPVVGRLELDACVVCPDGTVFLRHHRDRSAVSSPR